MTMKGNDNINKRKSHCLVCILFFSLSTYSVIMTVAWCWGLSSSSSSHYFSSSNNKKMKNLRDAYVIDVISIGCKAKEDCMTAQHETWVSHLST